MPFIVGCPRSGTTLLRLMMDAHPELAIPPETGFLALVSGWQHQPPRDPVAFTREIARYPPEAPVWPDFGIDEDAFARHLQAVEPFSADAAVRAFYQTYADRFAKSRVGDKTPAYCFHVGSIHTFLPEARFIHLVRDGRDVAVSWRAMWFSPGSQMADLAHGWVRHVEAVRRGRDLGAPVLEVRYESLVTRPRETMQAICDFVALPFHAAVLDHARTAASRLDEHGERLAADGRVVVSAGERRRQQAWALRPPSPDRIGMWRTVLTPGEVDEFEAVAGPLLEACGYREAAR